ncbi:hypothetical protein ACJJTC_016038 [Scirpophaga incertulas]
MVIFQRKVDSYTLRAYHLEMDANLEPKVEDFINYLEHRALALENASPSAVAAKHQQGYKAVNTPGGLVPAGQPGGFRMSKPNDFAGGNARRHDSRGMRCSSNCQIVVEIGRVCFE